ncbi:hypothetical protein ACFWZ2_43500, partial [Streptomyces sp. NPDC059002]|uniref:hypothetical protein n=1 Tax=Streptomyces sp. NPDC059002 TaxID=3346690 RepID=UPI003692970B
PPARLALADASPPLRPRDSARRYPGSAPRVCPVCAVRTAKVVPMNAPRLLAVPLLALALLGVGAASASAAEPFPQGASGSTASAVPFGDPFASDPFYADFFDRAQAHQEGADPHLVATRAPLCPPPVDGGAGSDALLDSDITSSTSIL